MQHRDGRRRRARVSGLLCGVILLVHCHATLRADPRQEATSLQTQPAAGDRTVVGTDETASKKPRVQVLKKGSSAPSALASGRALLPLDQLSPQDRAEAEDVLSAISLFRELPTLSVNADPQVYSFFATHPEVAVAMWRAMGISKFQLRPTGPNVYRSETGDGTRGVIRMLYRGPEDYVVLCEGVYNSPLLFKPVEAKALLHLQTRVSPQNERTTRVIHCVRMYVSFPSQTVETAAKLISPFSNWIIDRNFREVSLFVHMMSLAMSRQPGWVEHLAGRLEGVSAAQKRELLDLTAHVYVESRLRTASGPPQPDTQTLQDVMPPVREANSGRESPDGPAVPMPETQPTIETNRPQVAARPEPTSQ